MTVYELRCVPWLRLKYLLLGAMLLLPFASISAQTAAQRKALQHLAGIQPKATGPTVIEATGTPLSRPAGMAFDVSGNLYIADLNDNLIREVSPAGAISTVVGTGAQGYAGDGGPATSALLDSPAGVAVDAAGDIYIADTHNHRIREVVGGTITTIAGSGAAGFFGDGGPAAAAMLNLPTAIAIDASGNVYIADTNNHRIRKITGTTISTVAGDGDQIYLGDGGQATQTGLDSPNGVAVDAAGNLYIADTHNQRVRMVSASNGIISTLAGNGMKSFAGDGGAGSSASLARPRGVAVASDGTIEVADSDNQRIRNINNGVITTIAGTGGQGFSGDAGPATAAMFDTPRAVTVNLAGTVAIADTGNQRVREILDGDITTVAGQGGPGAELLILSGPSQVAMGSGTLTATFSNGSQNATGAVTFLDVTSGSSVLGSVPFANNVATITLFGVSAGTHLFVAIYSGDAVNPGITSAVFTVVITAASQVLNGFSIATTPSVQTVIPGHSTSYAIALTPQGETFGSAVTLTIAGLPSGATAAFTPSSIAVGAASTVSTLSIQTSASSAALTKPTQPWAISPAFGLLVLPLFSIRRVRRSLPALSSSMKLFLALLLLAGAEALSGCGSGGFFAQAQHSYSITVTATGAAIGSSPTVAHSNTITLTVQ